MAALSVKNMKWLVLEDPKKFGTDFLPLVAAEMNNKDEDVARLLAKSLEAVVDLQLVSEQSMLNLLDTLISNLRSFNKKSKHEIWTSLLIRLLELYGNASHIEMALDMAEPLNSNSSLRLAANIFTVQIRQAVEYEQQVV